MSVEQPLQEINEDSIIKIKKQIQEEIKSNDRINEELLNNINTYKVAINLEKLSENFGNVLELSQTPNPNS